MRSKTCLGMLVLGLLAAQGCASLRQAQTLEERVQAKWDALVAGDFATAYQYYSPGYRRNVLVENFDRAMRSRTIAWNKAEVGSLGNDCDESRCTVVVNVFYRVSPVVPGASEFNGVKGISESWIRVENDWYFVPRNPL